MEERELRSCVLNLSSIGSAYVALREDQMIACLAEVLESLDGVQ